MKNTGKKYEDMVHQVFSELKAVDSVKSIRLDKRQKIKDRNGIRREIDIIWEYEIALQKFLILIEAKDHSSPITITNIDAFLGKTNDIPGNPKLFFITKSGYQSGAKTKAEQHGIVLFEFRELTEKDLDGKIKKIVLQVNYLLPDTRFKRFIFDDEWNIQKLKEYKLYKFERKMDQLETEIILKSSISTQTLHEIMQKYVTTDIVGKGYIEINHKFTNPTFLITNDSTFPELKVIQIDFEVAMHKGDQTLEIEPSTNVGFILKETLNPTKRVTVFDKNVKMLR